MRRVESSLAAGAVDTEPALPCLLQVLSTLSLLFPLFEPSDTLARDCLIVFAIGVAFKLLFFVLFFARTANATLVPPANKALVPFADATLVPPANAALVTVPFADATLVLPAPASPTGPEAPVTSIVAS